MIPWVCLNYFPIFFWVTFCSMNKFCYTIPYLLILLNTAWYIFTSSYLFLIFHPQTSQCINSHGGNTFATHISSTKYLFIVTCTALASDSKHINCIIPRTECTPHPAGRTATFTALYFYGDPAFSVRSRYGTFCIESMFWQWLSDFLPQELGHSESFHSRK